jgi:hypothetical protein
MQLKMRAADDPDPAVDAPSDAESLAKPKVAPFFPFFLKMAPMVRTAS